VWGAHSTGASWKKREFPRPYLPPRPRWGPRARPTLSPIHFPSLPPTVRSDPAAAARPHDADEIGLGRAAPRTCARLRVARGGRRGTCRAPSCRRGCRGALRRRHGRTRRRRRRAAVLEEWSRFGPGLRLGGRNANAARFFDSCTLRIKDPLDYVFEFSFFFSFWFWTVV
jgi:hypothetical protein